jgi:hypothetical protein
VLHPHEHDVALRPRPCASSTTHPILPLSSPIRRPFCSCLLSSPRQPPSSTGTVAANLPYSPFHGHLRPPSPAFLLLPRHVLDHPDALEQLCEPLAPAIPCQSVVATLPHHHQLPLSVSDPPVTPCQQSHVATTPSHLPEPTGPHRSHLGHHHWPP